jgi:hypothetical protein
MLLTIALVSSGLINVAVNNPTLNLDPLGRRF